MDRPRQTSHRTVRALTLSSRRRSCQPGSPCSTAHPAGTRTPTVRTVSVGGTARGGLSTFKAPRRSNRMGSSRRPLRPTRHPRRPTGAMERRRRARRLRCPPFTRARRKHPSSPPLLRADIRIPSDHRVTSAGSTAPSEVRTSRLHSLSTSRRHRRLSFPAQAPQRPPRCRSQPGRTTRSTSS